MMTYIMNRTARFSLFTASNLSTSGRGSQNPFACVLGCKRAGGIWQAAQKGALNQCRNSSFRSESGPEDKQCLEESAHFELPDELQGLTISDDGQYLVDSKTGNTINEFGATRFDVAVRALRGEFDPPKNVENTERDDNILIGALKQFPLMYTFNIVFKGRQNETEVKQFISDMLLSVSGSPCQECGFSERLSGKYLSVKALALVRSPDMIASVFQELGKDPRVIMKY